MVQSNVSSISNLGTTSGAISCAQLLDTGDRRAMRKLDRQKMAKLTPEVGVLSLEIVSREDGCQFQKEAATEPMVP